MDVAWAAHKSVTAVALTSHILSHSVTNTRHLVKFVFHVHDHNYNKLCEIVLSERQLSLFQI